ncbi:MAG: helix-turn-helix transcriptional regulator, partial [Peptococcaceae bacterium]|nr:helix-turn-helix transcriptional regulator [Peptococcaceae bacterium]
MARKRLFGVIWRRMAQLNVSSRKQLAQLVGCHESTISRLLSDNEHVPHINLLHAMENVLQFPFGYLEDILNNQENMEASAMPVPLPSIPSSRTLFSLRVTSYPHLNELSQTLIRWEPLLGERLWMDWENGRSLPSQKQLLAVTRVLELSTFERGWLLGLSGIPVDWETMEEDTRRDLQREVDAWSIGPATSLGQPFGIYLTVNGLGCDLVNVPRKAVERMRQSRPSFLQAYAMTSSFIAPYGFAHWKIHQSGTLRSVERGPVDGLFFFALDQWVPPCHGQSVSPDRTYLVRKQNMPRVPWRAWFSAS